MPRGFVLSEVNPESRTLFCLLLVRFQFPLDFFNRRQTATEVLRQCLSQFVVGYAYGLLNITQGVFSLDTVFVFAKKQSYRLVVSLPAKNVVHGRTVEIQFADILRHELRIFQLYYQIPVQECIV